MLSVHILFQCTFFLLTFTAYLVADEFACDMNNLNQNNENQNLLIKVPLGANASSTIIYHEEEIHVPSFNIRYFIAFYCFVLVGWSLLPHALRCFQDLLCSPEFRYFVQRSFFSGLRFFNESEISDSRPPA